MAQEPANRVYTCDLQILGIGGKAGVIGAAFADFLGIMTNVRLSVSKEFADPAVPYDVAASGVLGFKKRRFKRRRWTVDLTADSDISVPSTLLLYLALAKGAAGDEKNRGMISIKLWKPGLGTSGGTSYYQGTAFITEAVFTLGNQGPIVQSGTLTGVGPLTRVP